MDQKLCMSLLGWNCGNDEGGKEFKWSKHFLCIPYAFADSGCCLPGNLPTGLMLLSGPTEQQDDQTLRQLEEEEEVDNSKKLRKASPPIYSYHLLNDKFDEFVIGGNKSTSTSLIGRDTSKFGLHT